MPRAPTKQDREADVRRVFEAWRERQARPEQVTLGDDRRELIAARLRRGYTADDLVRLVRYAYDSDTSEARMWRGDNDRARTYLGLDNLLRSTKLADRVDRARAWADHPLASDAVRDDDDETVRLSPVGALRRRG